MLSVCQRSWKVTSMPRASMISPIWGDPLPGCEASLLEDRYIDRRYLLLKRAKTAKRALRRKIALAQAVRDMRRSNLGSFLELICL